MGSKGCPHSHRERRTPRGCIGAVLAVRMRAQRCARAALSGASVGLRAPRSGAYKQGLAQPLHLAARDAARARQAVWPATARIAASVTPSGQCARSYNVVHRYLVTQAFGRAGPMASGAPRPYCPGSLITARARVVLDPARPPPGAGRAASYQCGGRGIPNSAGAGAGDGAPRLRPSQQGRGRCRVSERARAAVPRHCSGSAPAAGEASPVYPEEVQAKAIRSEDYYHGYAMQRVYFYYIDLQGAPLAPMRGMRRPAPLALPALPLMATRLL